MPWSEKTGCLAVADADAGAVNGSGNDGKGRSARDSGTFPLRQHRPEVRIFAAILKQPAGLHQLMAGFMNRRRRVMDRAHDGKLVRPRRHPRQVFAELDAGNARADGSKRPTNIGGRIGLWIERIDVARPADEKQQNAIDVFACGGGAQKAQIGERQARD